MCAIKISFNYESQHNFIILNGTSCIILLDELLKHIVHLFMHNSLFFLLFNFVFQKSYLRSFVNLKINFNFVIKKNT